MKLKRITMIKTINNFGQWAYTIAFKNKSFEGQDIIIWVLEDKEAYEKRLLELQNMKHIEIVQNGLSQVKSENQSDVERIINR